MFRYTLNGDELVKTEVDAGKMTVADLQSRAYVPPAPAYTFEHYYCGGGYKGYHKQRNMDNSIFVRGLGTKSYTPSNGVKWDGARKCFVWRYDNSRYEIIDAQNVYMTIRGYYLSEFDINTLPNTKNPKQNKKRYAALNKYMEDLLKESKHWDEKAIADTAFDYTRQDRLNEFRALWMVRHLLTKAFKAGKRITRTTVTEMFIKTDYVSKFPNNAHSFGRYVRETGEALVDYLTAETDKNGQ